MNKQYFLVFLLAVLSAASSNAQINVGAGFGINSYRIQTVDSARIVSSDYIGRPGNQFGIMGEKVFNDAWAAHLAIVYSMQFSLNYMTRLETRMEYIKVQPMVKYSGFSPDWMKRMYVKGGIYYGYATRGLIRDYAGVDDEEIKLKPGKDNCIKKASDLGLAAEVGFQIKRVQVGVFGQAGFLDTSNVKGLTETNLGWGVHFTYLFFKRK